MTTKYKMEWPYLLYVRQAVFEFIASSALEPSPENPGVPFLYYTAENKVLSYPIDTIKSFLLAGKSESKVIIIVSCS